MIVRRVVAVAMALGASLSAGVASAEDQYYRFDDDLLGAEGLEPTGPIIKGTGKRPITTLLRPRVSFVPELLKSVEKI